MHNLVIIIILAFFLNSSGCRADCIPIEIEQIEGPSQYSDFEMGIKLVFVAKVQ